MLYKMWNCIVNRLFWQHICAWIRQIYNMPRIFSSANCQKSWQNSATDSLYKENLEENNKTINFYFAKTFCKEKKFNEFLSVSHSVFVNMFITFYRLNSVNATPRLKKRKISPCKKHLPSLWFSERMTRFSYVVTRFFTNSWQNPLEI